MYLRCPLGLSRRIYGLGEPLWRESAVECCWELEISLGEFPSIHLDSVSDSDMRVERLDDGNGALHSGRWGKR
jgi:hypothetical protein